MRLINLIKSVPFLLTVFVILILFSNNQKEYTKLKILIWNTPSLSLGTYLAISIGSGYMISYLVTNNVAKGNQLVLDQYIKYKPDNPKELGNLYNESDIEKDVRFYDNTLIERDIKDPSPTINASFRVISKTNRRYQTLEDNYNEEFDTSDLPNRTNQKSYEKESKYKNDNEINPIINDWEEDTYSNW